jgi:hypothetical protein
MVARMKLGRLESLGVGGECSQVVEFLREDEEEENRVDGQGGSP